MALFDRFRNKSNKDILPEEVEEYYQSEHRERRGVAVLLGIFTLIITLAVAGLIFFGTRAIYRNISGSDKSSETSTTTSKDTKNTGTNGSQTPAATTPATTSQGTNPSSNTTAPAPTSAPSTPSTGDSTPMPSTGDLPRTGDPGL